jgi:hypothetical protein
MSEFEVTTYVQRAHEDLPEVLRRYRWVLERLGFADASLAEWLSGITWEPDGSGFGYLGTPAVLSSVTAAGRQWIAQPFVLGYTDAAIPHLQVPWIQLSLQFEDNVAEAPALIDEASGKYMPGVGAAMWQVVMGFSRVFREVGVYFNDAPTVSAPWYSMTGRDGDRWAFDLAMVPKLLATYFQPIPPGYANRHFADGIGIARTLSWTTIPWLETG